MQLVGCDVAALLAEYRLLVEDRLRTLLRGISGCPGSLSEAIEYSLLAPGKRLRPVLAMLAAEASGGKANDALSAGCAVEMVHAYSLIHDDLPAMDDDDLRRGRPSAHRKFGEALAILAGDALLTLAFDVLASEYSAATAAACCRELASAAGAVGMVGGQVDDLTWEGKISGAKVSQDVAGLAGIHSRKTGALFRASLRLGLLVAQGECPGGPDQTLWRLLDAYGRSFGLVFQITDDLLDVEGDAAAAGKRLGKDAQRGKFTYPGLLGVEESRRRVESFIEQASEALRPVGLPAEPLEALVRMMGQRDR
jgi:geranylgeranyl diphosphate synthase, type II